MYVIIIMVLSINRLPWSCNRPNPDELWIISARICYVTNHYVYRYGKWLPHDTERDRERERERENLAVALFTSHWCIHFYMCWFIKTFIVFLRESFYCLWHFQTKISPKLWQVVNTILYILFLKQSRRVQNAYLCVFYCCFSTPLVSQSMSLHWILRRNVTTFVALFLSIPYTHTHIHTHAYMHRSMQIILYTKKDIQKKKKSYYDIYSLNNVILTKYIVMSVKTVVCIVMLNGRLFDLLYISSITK